MACIARIDVTREHAPMSSIAKVDRPPGLPNCSLENKSIECSGVAAAIRAQYPTSKPRVDICLDKQSRYEAAAEVMKSVSDAGFAVGNFHCGTPPATR